MYQFAVRENAKEAFEARMSRSEIVSQMRTIMLAGQETTSNTLSWALCELARQPHIQSRLRAEVRDAEHMLRARGDADFTVADFEALPYLQAVLKEILRFYPVVPHLYRQSAYDDVLPLSKPVTTRSGKVLTALPIRKGLRLILSTCAYNRCVDHSFPSALHPARSSCHVSLARGRLECRNMANCLLLCARREKEVWGADAHEFNPDRWLDASKARRGTAVGVYANLYVTRTSSYRTARVR